MKNLHALVLTLAVGLCARTEDKPGAGGTAVDSAVTPVGSVAPVRRNNSAPPSVYPDTTHRPDTTGDDLDVLRHELSLPLAGLQPSSYHDTFQELRGGTRPHEALDILAPRGTPVLSAADGTLLKLFDSKAGGLMVYASDASGRFILKYGHLDAYQPGLVEGQALRRGQQIGIVGTTGNAPANTPHLHFAIARAVDLHKWWEGEAVNPYPLLSKGNKQ